VGYVAFFRLRQGFEKFIYMTKGQVNAHAKRYSQSFGKEYGPWKTHLDEMSIKTPLKLLLSKFGVLSIEMQKAVTYDQGVITETPQGETVEFPDNEAQEAQVVEPDEANDAING
jgi:recombination protein RecT